MVTPLTAGGETVFGALEASRVGQVASLLSRLWKANGVKILTLQPCSCKFVNQYLWFVVP